MALRPRLAFSTSVLGVALVFALLGVVSSGASVKAGGKVVSAKLSKKSFTAPQAKTVKLTYKLSPTSKRLGYQLSLKKSAKWAKVRSVNKTGSFKGSYKTTVKKLFGSKSIKVGQYRIKVSADANSLTRKFTVKNPSSSNVSGDDGSGSEGSGSRDSGDCGADCEEDSGDVVSGDEDSGDEDTGDEDTGPTR